MILKSMGMVAIGLVGGCVATLLFKSCWTQEGVAPGAALAGASAAHDSNLEREKSALQIQVTTLTSELEALRAHAGTAAMPAVRKTPEEMSKAMLEASKDMYAGALQQETDQLVAAGFSMERIQWLRNRTEELETKRRKAETDRLKAGLPPEKDALYKDAAYRLDSDLDLADEIGADEYGRYRQALGRSNGIQVTSVNRGGIAESAGLKVGDVVTKYDGKRVYNIAQIDTVARTGEPGEMVTVEVLREGKPAQLTALKGELGILYPAPLPSRTQIMNLGMLSTPPN